MLCNWTPFAFHAVKQGSLPASEDASQATLLCQRQGKQGMEDSCI